ncbi:MAG: von Willebrand factor type A domain-containing protein, partial [Euryarchaeota archaeon]|nr:von Willebrand factor type A domain-containing protein [Euryarchaeota archaeon]
MMMGYKPLETKIVVLADSNVVAVFKLEATIVDRTQTITVTGQKAMIDVRSSQVGASVRGQQLNQMPIDDVLEAVALKAGVVKRGDEMFVRGGRLLNRYRNDFRTESYERIYENEFLGSIDNPFSTFSIDVDAASYSNVRRFIRGHRLPPPGAVRIEELINYFEYDYPQPKNSIPFTITTEVSRCP